eukprot:TRINITY_DN1233_c1_g1_i1.p1 TRINITY_DN1233_c1_g1~~TRINITY_DN1233_c1_g1_i1.p1  ORF type:complete len:751 (+),score=180.37 TRINITY_DN1233_c1_g1_i1:116-2254(+)
MSATSSLSTATQVSSGAAPDRSLDMQRARDFYRVWNDNGTCFKPTSVTVWQPQPPPGYFVLGDVMERNVSASDGAHSVTLLPSQTTSVVVRDTDRDRCPPLLAPPADFEEVWSTRNTGSNFGEVTFYRPIPPPGYVACGVVVAEGHSKPPTDRPIACVHESVAAPGFATPEQGKFPQLWGTERNKFRSLVIPKDHIYIHTWRVLPVDETGINAGCFSVTSRTPSQKDREILWCLKKPTEAAHPIEEEHFRYGSFVEPRSNIDARWFVDGESYMSTVADALQTATSEIFMSGWCISPELYLKRGSGATVDDRLDQILKKMAHRGVHIYVLLWFETEAAVGGLVKSENAKKVLERLHPNIRVVRHPTGASNLFWTHHQKFVVIDQKIAFIGGIDLCFGRFDDPSHPLVDDCHLQMRFPGKDYYQPCVRDFDDLENPFNDLVDRTVHPRMPWHDIHAMVNREAARDIAQNFLQRWNHHVLAKQDRTKYPFLEPLVNIPEDDHTRPGSCQVQVCRSIAGWSAGLATPERSIQNAYLELIRTAEHYIYIENQYFISVKNGVVDALYERISRAIDQGEVFRVFVLLPVNPCGSWEATPNLCVMKWQYDSISRGGRSLRERVEAKLREKYPPPDMPPHGGADRYVGFFSLRQMASLRGDVVGDQVYIHSKLMIVDDRTALIGTANINDRRCACCLPYPCLCSPSSFLHLFILILHLSSS